MGTKMSPRATIVDSRAFYKADVSIELSKIEFSHSLGRLRPLHVALIREHVPPNHGLQGDTPLAARA